MWQCVPGITLSQRRDSISWKWTPSGSYTAASAYFTQFYGSFPPFLVTKVWKAHAEPECKYFALTIVHRRILTADNLAT
ncbi:hypothetical protein BRADI_3g02782v3 [Brachypodium distachyon]|uniref:Uncharacterized protein n=1 Tax=Brachypodium distachyon TaxID=15368 RepID=A0A0Q3HXY5_BRADI|nr:hypothetical protein BRADI_3g02782v3 [Brachypodium distachyon]